MSQVVTVPELLDGHTVLDIECLDRIYLNGYVPTLQVGGQVVTFLHDHRGMPIASPAVFEQIGTRFRQAVGRFAEMNDIPMVKFKKGMRKIDVMRPLLAAGGACGPARGGGDRLGAGVPAGVGCAQARHRPVQAPAVLLRQGRTPGDLLLLLPLGRVLGACVHQDLRVFPLPGQGLAQRP